MTFRLKEQYGHETRWWSDEQPMMDSFLASHARDPLPDVVSWETSDTARFGRAHWVIVDELGTAARELAPATPNDVTPAARGLGVGMWTDVAGEGVQLRMIQPGSIADVYALRDGDVIEQVNDTSTVTFEQLVAALQAAAGTVARIHVARGNQRRVQPLNVPAVPDPAPQAAFPRAQPSGRIDAERNGNTITVRTRGVRRFTLLLSADDFDFSKPLTVRANDAVVFESVLRPSAEVLLKWAARDNDRTMLFAQELTITLP